LVTAKLNLEHYEHQLAAQGYVEEDDLKDADDADLAELGFTKLDTKRLRSYLAN
jgi:hypothetical protein